MMERAIIDKLNNDLREIESMLFRHPLVNWDWRTVNDEVSYNKEFETVINISLPIIRMRYRINGHLSPLSQEALSNYLDSGVECLDRYLAYLLLVIKRAVDFTFRSYARKSEYFKLDIESERNVMELYNVTLNLENRLNIGESVSMPDYCFLMIRSLRAIELSTNRVKYDLNILKEKDLKSGLTFDSVFKTEEEKKMCMGLLRHLEIIDDSGTCQLTQRKGGILFAAITELRFRIQNVYTEADLLKVFNKLLNTTYAQIKKDGKSFNESIRLARTYLGNPLK